MLRERYAPMHVFDLVPTLRLARDPVWTQLDRLLADDTRFQTVKADLACRFPRTLRDGRPSTPVEVILRMLGDNRPQPAGDRPGDGCLTSQAGPKGGGYL
jgi:hypothetical protein